jgi:hypothetical protein
VAPQKETATSDSIFLQSWPGLAIFERASSFAYHHLLKRWNSVLPLGVDRGFKTIVKWRAVDTDGLLSLNLTSVSGVVMSSIFTTDLQYSQRKKRCQLGDKS